MNRVHETSTEAPRPDVPRAWVAPTIQDMPRLVDLTLQTGLVMTSTRSRRGFRV